MQTLPGLGARYWAELKTTDFSALPADTVAMVPVGAIEQHGPHLPVSTDMTIAEGMAAAIASRVTQGSVLVLPGVSYGKSDEHLDFAGTVSLDEATLLSILIAIGQGVRRAGLRRIVFLNAHGGNVPVIQIACRKLRVESGLFAVAAGWMSMGMPDGLLSPSEVRDGIHGGLAETALMLHFRPDLVDMKLAENFVPQSGAVAESNSVLRMLGPVSAGWIAQDLHPKGAAGDASGATAATGLKIVEHVATRYLTLLQEIARHPAPGPVTGK